VKPLAITQYTVASALGLGLGPTLAALQAGRTGLAARDFETAHIGTWLGVVDAVADVTLPPELADHDCRNNRLAQLALLADGLAKRAPGRAALGRGPCGGVPGHHHIGHPAD
jgi:3-oxoacyl-[acyl-carrier-protein] synthase-1